ncbi:MAG: bacteriohopanetetrol glucosamine biosynthesis glycosyltransferase HpnI [Anaerolineae bacterium]|nr:bacteriohopanetetrol glucosamine biosynthesis glycosyltransferase HpnI [Anaerolineae bacterium]
MIATLLTALILISWFYWLVALWLVFAFFRPPAGHREATASSAGAACGSSRATAAEHPENKPPVSILKPVKGVDAQAYQNFVSFCRQDYPEYELLFGVADADDPVIPLIERLKREFPHLSIRLLVVRPTGANRKASLLHHLVEQARYDTLVISDSDMRVTPDYLPRVVGPLSDPAVGLVTCPYLGTDAQNLTAGLEALHMGVSFLPSIVVARQVIGMRFAMGATVALRRSDLMRIGGFAALADYLADDYQLGARISQLGLKVRLSDYVVRCVLGREPFWDQWEREVRWMRCASVSRPWQYPGLVLSFATPLALTLFLINGPGWPVTQLLLGSLLLRWVVAWLISGCTGDSESRSWLLWLPVRDVLSALTWIVGGLGRRIAWRGEEFVLTSQGRMAPAPPRRTAQLTAWLRRLH